MLSSEKLAAKARKWIGSHSERRGEANLSLESFAKYLSGTWDEKKAEWAEKGLLSDVLKAQGKAQGKARNYQTVLREGADAFSIHKDVKELKKKRLVWGKAAAESQKPGSKGGAHASHRRPAPSEYNAE